MRKKHGPLDLTGPDAAVLLQEEREETPRLETREREDEDRRDWNESQRAIDAGHTLTDFRGKRFRGRGSNPSIAAIHPQNANGRGDDITKIMYALTFDEFFSKIDALTKTFKAMTTPLENPYNNRPSTAQQMQPEYIFEEMMVSAGTRQKLKHEIFEMAELDRDIEESTDPWQENEMRDHRSLLLDKYEMQPLPGSAGYAFSESRIRKIEEDMEPSQLMVPIIVCRKVQRHIDDRGVIVKVGDPNNGEVVEVISSGDHLKGAAPARPVGPEFHHG